MAEAHMKSRGSPVFQAVMKAVPEAAIDPINSERASLNSESTSEM